ncbi:MAG: hypothetical protein PUB32_10290 [Clostridiales bacterium]|nr:hypothetical protein [Clostridiales bacterium]
MKNFKRVIALVMALIMCLSLCACGKSEAAKAADELIASLGPITLNSESKIAEAEAAVAALTEKERGQLEKLQVLEDAKADYDTLLIKVVEDAINAIGNVTLDSENAINSARAEYTALDAALQPSVSNYNVLTAAEEAYFGAKVKAVEEPIANIGSVTLESVDVIAAARAAYDAAEPDVQSAVGNYGVLTAAEEAYTALRAQEVIDLINAIGTVTLDSSAAINAAQSAYDALDANEAALVNNADILANAAVELKNVKDAYAEKMLSKMTVEEDKVRGMSFYYPKAFPYYSTYWGADVRCFVLPYIGRSKDAVWMRLICDYTSDDWVFFKKIIFAVDDERITKSFGDFDVTRDNGGGDVWEYVDIDVGTSELNLLEAIANSTETIVRFEGDDYYYDFTVRDSDKTAIRETLDTYYALMG